MYTISLALRDGTIFRQTRLAGCAAVGIALMAIPTIASAHGGNNDPNVVHACIGNVTKIVRIVGVDGTCITSPPAIAETPAHWAIQGQPGAPGINGTNGTNGTNGANGIDGTSVTFAGYFSGNANGCANGGVIFQAAGSVLAYVCNGVNGTNGTGTRAAGPCFWDNGRYVDCGNGTVTDTVTGLIWLQQANCFSAVSWAAANHAAAGLKNGDCGLTDGSTPGDWRLPTRSEWAATIAVFRAGQYCTAPSLTDDSGLYCYDKGVGSSFPGVTGGNYWSSTAFDNDPSNAWFAALFGGGLGTQFKTTNFGAWPVRGGQR